MSYVREHQGVYAAQWLIWRLGFWCHGSMVGVWLGRNSATIKQRFDYGKGNGPD